MKFDTVIKGGTLVSAAETITADIGITGGRIAALGLGLPMDGGEVISAKQP
jgi:dihydropyrimidinase